MTSADNWETLYLYLAVTEKAINVVLVKEQSGIQYLIYYVNKALNGLESRYSSTEKLALCLVHAARHLSLWLTLSVLELTSLYAKT